MDDKLHIIAHKYVVSTDDIDEGLKWDHYSPLTVEYRGKGKWAVMHSGSCWNKNNGCFDYEPSPSARDGSFLHNCRFDTFEDAVKSVKEAYEYINKKREEEVRRAKDLQLENWDNSSYLSM